MLYKRILLTCSVDVLIRRLTFKSTRYLSLCNNNTRESNQTVSSLQIYNSQNSKSSWWWMAVGLPFLTLHAKQKEDDADRDVTAATTGYRHKFNFIADVVERVIPSVVQIQIKSSTLFGTVPVASGSGFIVSPDGLVITNAHVIRNMSQDLSVKLQDGRSYRGRVLKIDKMADLALIKIDCDHKLNFIKFGESDSVRCGEFVVALGSPLSLNNTVTSGVVSNPLRDGLELGIHNQLSYIQTDAPITFGNSGGPLVNLDGEVIGVNSMTAAPGISFAIPAKYARQMINTKQIMTAKYRYIGLKMVSITPMIYDLFNYETATDIKLPPGIKQGCLVVEVAPNSPAERSGLKRGDVIIAANDSPIVFNNELTTIIKSSTGSVRLRVIRCQKELRFDLIPEERSD